MEDLRRSSPNSRVCLPRRRNVSVRPRLLSTLGTAFSFLALLTLHLTPRLSWIGTNKTRNSCDCLNIVSCGGHPPTHLETHHQAYYEKDTPFHEYTKYNEYKAPIMSTLHINNEYIALATRQPQQHQNQKTTQQSIQSIQQ